MTSFLLLFRFIDRNGLNMIVDSLLENSALLKRLSLSIAVSIANFFIIYVLNIFLAKQLGAEDYGDYAVAIATATFLALIATLGLEKLATRFLPTIWQHGEYEKGHGLLRYSLSLTISASLVVALVGALVMGVFVTNGYQHPLFIALWLVPLLSLMKLFSFWIRSTDHYMAAQAPNFLQEPLLMLGLVVFIFVMDQQITDHLAIKLVFISTFSVLIVQFLYLYKFLPRVLFTLKPQYEIKKWLQVALPMMLATLVFLAMQQVDLWMLELLGGSEENVGHYSAITRTMGFFILMGTAIGTYLLPSISFAIEQNKIVELQSIIVIAQRVLISTALGLALIIIFAGKKILGLFGPDFIATFPALVVNMIGYFINLIFYLSFIILQNSGYERRTLVSACVILGIHILLDIMLIPSFGLLGAVSASTITLSCLYLWYTWLVWKKIKIHLLPF